jgi:hypothetical protein
MWSPGAVTRRMQLSAAVLIGDWQTGTVYEITA